MPYMVLNNIHILDIVGINPTAKKNDKTNRKPLPTSKAEKLDAKFRKLLENKTKIVL